MAIECIGHNSYSCLESNTPLAAANSARLPQPHPPPNWCATGMPCASVCVFEQGEPDAVGQEANWNRLNQYTADYCDAIDKYIAGEWSEVCLAPPNLRSHCSTS